MSLFASMRTALSGMNAQGTRLATTSDNISNANTVGYKAATTEFETVLGEQSSRSYVSGGVTAHVRQAVQTQGAVRGTANATDLAISGNGFFVVTNDSGGTFLTRAGTFVPDQDGFLVNEAGYKLLGFPVGNTIPAGPAGIRETYPINIDKMSLLATASTKGSFTANLDSAASITPAADLPSTNSPTAVAGAKTSLVVYGDLGTPVTLDVYFNKTAANAWEVTVYDKADAGGPAGFPYSSGPLSTTSLSFDPSTGKLPAGTSISLNIPAGETLNLDVSKTTQLASAFQVLNTQTDGNAPSAIETVEVGEDGTLFAVYDNGSRIPTYKIPLGTVRGPENLIPVNGNAYQVSPKSGDIVIADAKSAGLGKIIGSSVEESTVDLGTELATMIEAQRGYTANSKVFQTSADLLDVLVNLK